MFCIDPMHPEQNVKKRFKNRTEAGKELGQAFKLRHHFRDPVVIGLARGGVAVAYEVAKILSAPLDVCVVRKLGVPGSRELAMGALAPGGIRVINRDVVHNYAVPGAEIDRVTAEEEKTLSARERLYRGERSAADVSGKSAILVDDGLATGSTIYAAILSLRNKGPQKVIVGAPLGAYDTSQEIRKVVDDFVCLFTPEPFYAISLWYEDFRQVTDEEVKSWLHEAAAIPHS